MMSASEPRPMTVTGPVNRYRCPSMSTSGWRGLGAALAAGAAAPRAVADRIRNRAASRSSRSTKVTVTGPTKTYRCEAAYSVTFAAVSYTHLRAHETRHD